MSKTRKNNKYKYAEYLEETLGENGYLRSVPNKDKLVALLKSGADIDSYFTDHTDYYSRYRTSTGSTLLAGLILRLPNESGKKKEKLLELIDFAIRSGADVNYGRREIDPEKRKPTSKYYTTPLTLAINLRIPSIITLLLNNNAEVSLDNINTWISYILEARTANEIEKLVPILNLLLSQGATVKPMRLRSIFIDLIKNPINQTSLEKTIALVRLFMSHGSTLEKSDIDLLLSALERDLTATDVELIKEFLSFLFQNGLQSSMVSVEPVLNYMGRVRDDSQRLEKAYTLLNLFLSKGKQVPASFVQEWFSLLQTASWDADRVLMRKIMKFLNPSYEDGDEFPVRPVPDDAIDTITQNDFQDGELLIDVNNEYSKGYYYSLDSWKLYLTMDAAYQQELYEEWFIEPRKQIISPVTRLPVKSLTIYKAQIMGPVQERANFRGIQTNLFQGGKRRKTRKLNKKRKY